MRDKERHRVWQGEAQRDRENAYRYEVTATRFGYTSIIRILVTICTGCRPCYHGLWLSAIHTKIQPASPQTGSPEEGEHMGEYIRGAEKYGGKYA